MKKMNDIVKRCRKYVQKDLTKQNGLDKYIKQSTILLYSYERNYIWDLLILMDNELFKNDFVFQFSENFIIDDHKHDPSVFVRVKNYSWLKDDFNKRLPVVLWIFENALVIQEYGNNFSQILYENKKLFTKKLFGIIKRKYLEMRGDRHNLRRSIKKSNDLASIILKSNIVKLCFELSLLAEGKAYPFRCFLPEYAKSRASFGNDIFIISNKFIAETDQNKIIDLSDCLIEKVSRALRLNGNFSKDFLDRWWLYLD
jgi:hypothetical protein